jgi:uncharacterized damage-inducible protein DinB
MITVRRTCRSGARQFLLHIVVHATQQQSNAATLLTLAGQSPEDLGYLEWLAAG